MIKHVLLVGIGGFIGSVARYLSAVIVYKFCDPVNFPFATLFVNFVGCFIIGMAGDLLSPSRPPHPDLRIFLIVGILGGFTTYSAFGYETLTLIRETRIMAALFNIIVHIILGLIAVWLGTLAARSL